MKLLALFLMTFSLNAKAEMPTLSKKSKYASPKLIVTIMIDQFRSDYIQKYKNDFLKAKNGKSLGGFLYLLENGSYYQYGQYDILQSMTAPGHATIMTGSYPYKNGIVMNEWYDHNLKKEVDAIDDEAHPITSLPNITLYGKSPHNLLTETLGDELKKTSPYSKVVSIALKDRASIFMGGHKADVALWFEEKYQSWATSSYYQKKESHLNLLNQLNLQKNKIKTPKLNSVFESDYASPFGGYLTVKAAIATINHFDLGNHKDPDLLTISFSSHDVVGHRFDINSLQMKEMTIHEDRNISELLNYLNAHVKGGLENVVIVLSADHGIAPSVEYLKQNKQSAGLITDQEIKQKVEHQLNQKFGKIKGKWLDEHIAFNLYFSKEALIKVKQNQKLLEDETKKVLLQIEGVKFVFSKSDYEEKKLPPGMFERLINKTYFIGRSGDVVLIPKPFYIESETINDPLNEHMTGYSYDKTVPVIFLGKAFKAQHNPQIVEVVDVAPTLSYLLGISAPNGNEGRILRESLK